MELRWDQLVMALTFTIHQSIITPPREAM